MDPAFVILERHRLAGTKGEKLFQERRGLDRTALEVHPEKPHPGQFLGLQEEFFPFRKELLPFRGRVGNLFRKARCIRDGRFRGGNPGGASRVCRLSDGSRLPSGKKGAHGRGEDENRHHGQAEPTGWKICRCCLGRSGKKQGCRQGEAEGKGGRAGQGTLSGKAPPEPFTEQGG